MSSADSSGILRCHICFLDIQVSKAALGRALIIMDSIIKAMELQGGQVVSGDNNKTLVHMDGVDIRFGIEEEVDLLEDDIAFRDVPSGRLLLKIHEYRGYSTHRFQKNWRDTKRKKLEDRLNGFFKGLQN